MRSIATRFLLPACLAVFVYAGGSLMTAYADEAGPDPGLAECGCYDSLHCHDGNVCAVRNCDPQKGENLRGICGNTNKAN
jgi:hypothetical protein